MTGQKLEPMQVANDSRTENQDHSRSPALAVIYDIYVTSRRQWGEPCGAAFG
jgi:hypothetical protein